MTAPKDFDWGAWADEQNKRTDKAVVGSIEPVNWKAFLVRMQHLEAEVGRLKSKVAYLEGALPT